MNARELVQAGRLNESLLKLQEEIRAAAADEKLRVFLFQLLSVLGKWERALTQLQVLTSMSPPAVMLARIFDPVVRCEAVRAEVFAGKRNPLIFGEPEEWLGLLVKANELTSLGQHAAAAQLREQAFAAAPATAGKIGEKPFEWIADADQRFGPVLEVILEGQYYWIPIHRISRIVIDAPSDLRDLVWAPAQFVWANGGEASGHIPSRYPKTELSDDDALRLSRKTDWLPLDKDFSVGLGQRILTTDTEDIPLLGCGIIDLQTAVAAPAANAG